jgi:hypothetical protein
VLPAERNTRRIRRKFGGQVAGIGISPPNPPFFCFKDAKEENGQ